ncbi:MAG: PA3496 family putative envelope integrity protein [Methylobacter sp.]
MTMKVSKSVSDKSTPEAGIDKSKDDVDLDMEGFDLGMSSEYMSLPNESERAAKKMAARRKIELYWEKKRLQEQLGDFDEDDLDF